MCICHGRDSKQASRGQVFFGKYCNFIKWRYFSSSFYKWTPKRKPEESMRAISQKYIWKIQIVFSGYVIMDLVRPNFVPDVMSRLSENLCAKVEMPRFLFPSHVYVGAPNETIHLPLVTLLMMSFEGQKVSGSGVCHWWIQRVNSCLWEIKYFIELGHVKNYCGLKEDWKIDQLPIALKEMRLYIKRENEKCSVENKKVCGYAGSGLHALPTCSPRSHHPSFIFFPF